MSFSEQRLRQNMAKCMSTLTSLHSYNIYNNISKFIILSSRNRAEFSLVNIICTLSYLIFLSDFIKKYTHVRVNMTFYGRYTFIEPDTEFESEYCDYLSVFFSQA